MATVRQIADIIEQLFPPENVCMHDYLGLMTGSFGGKVGKVIVCLDCTRRVLEEAERCGAELIVSHHPLIFGSLTSVTDETSAGGIILRAARSGINVYSAHTNMDCTTGGICDYTARLLGIKKTSPLIKINENAGLGVVGELADRTSLRDYADFISKKLSDKYVKIYGTDRNIKTVAIVNGAGGDTDLIEAAASAGVDCFVTGEIKHHAALRAAELGLNIIETSHYASERVFIPHLAELIASAAAEKHIEIQVTASEYESNPAL